MQDQVVYAVMDPRDTTPMEYHQATKPAKTHRGGRRIRRYILK
jgi:hypothetical protein